MLKATDSFHICIGNNTYIGNIISIYYVVTMLMKEVLPAPFGPSKPKHFPRATARDNPLTACYLGYPSCAGYVFWSLQEMIG